jgi:hypothetical protein
MDPATLVKQERQAHAVALQLIEAEEKVIEHERERARERERQQVYSVALHLIQARERV